MKVSIGFYQFLVHILALYPFTLVLILTNRGPNNPLTNPRIIAPGITAVGEISTTLMFPNLSDAAVQP